MSPRPTRKSTVLSLHRDITLLLTPPKKAGITNHFKSVPPNELFENSRDGNPLDMVARVNKVSTGRKSTINNEEGGPLSQMELFFWSRLEDQLPILSLHVAIPSGWSPSLYLGVLCSSTQGQKGCMILYQPKSITKDLVILSLLLMKLSCVSVSAQKISGKQWFSTQRLAE